MRMKVPLAGPHQDVFETPSKEQDLPAPRVGDRQQESQPVVSPTTAKPPPSPTPQPVVVKQGPPPPSAPPIFMRLIPYILIIGFIGIVVFLATRFVPSLLQGRSSGPVQLTYWGLWEEEAAMDIIIKDFERENPNVKITYQKQSIKQYRETLTNRLSQGEGPDVFRFHNTWAPMLKDYLSQIPSNVYTNEEFEKTFYPVAADDLKVGSSYVGIPLEIDTISLFINEDDFKAAGLSPPKTWDELRKAARQLTVYDSQKRIEKAGVALGTFDNIDHASDILALMMLQNGVDLKNKKVATSTSQDGSNLAEDTLSYYVSFAQGENRVWDETLDPSTLAFTKGKLAMYFGYSWRIFEIKAINPTLNFSVVSVPQLPGSIKTLASYWVEGASKKSRFQKEAFMFLKYLSKPETMQKLYAQQSTLRLFGEPYSRKDMASLLKNNKNVSPFLELADNAVSWYLVSNTYDNGVNDRMINYFADAIRSVGTKNVSPKTALETVAKGVDTVSAQYGL